MSAARAYDDPCGTARALNVIGERWALLTVRELLFGPKRFGALRDGLHGISPNVLAQRLRELEQAGIVRREILPPPANVAVYELTERGQALERILIELGRWGSREPIDSAEELGVDALMLALKTTFEPAHAFDAIFTIGVNDDWFSLTVRAGSIDVRRGRQSITDAGLETDAVTLRAVAFGRQSVTDAERSGRMTITGDRRAARRFPKLFAVPGPR